MSEPSHTDPLEGASADEVLQDTLRRMEFEIHGQAVWIEDLLDQLAYARSQHKLALAAAASIAALLAAHNSEGVDGEAAVVAVANQPAAHALPDPSSDPLDWSKVRAPWSDAHWLKAYGMAWPVIREAKAPPVEAPTPKAPQGRVSPLQPDGRTLADAQNDRAMVALTSLCAETGEVCITLGALAALSDVPQGSMLFVIRRLEEAGKVTVEKPPNEGGARKPNTYRIVGWAPAGDPPVTVEAAPPVEAVAAPEPEDIPAAKPKLASDMLLNVLKGIASPQGLATGSTAELCAAAMIPFDAFDSAKGALIKRGEVKLFSSPSRPGGAWSFRVTSMTPQKAAAAAPQPTKVPQSPVRFIAAALDEAQPPQPAAASVPATVEARTAPAPKPITAEAFIPDEPDRDYTGPTTLMNLRRIDCHWPVGDARPQMYCAKPVDGKGQYCAVHAAAMSPATTGKAPRPLDDRTRDIRAQAAREQRA